MKVFKIKSCATPRSNVTLDFYASFLYNTLIIHITHNHVTQDFNIKTCIKLDGVETKTSHNSFITATPLQLFKF